MHLIITDPWIAKRHVLHVSGVQLVGVLAGWFVCACAAWGSPGEQ
jgi:hypothetical protein